MSLFEKHKNILNKAINALHERTFFAAYPEHPSPTIYGESADEDGRKKFQSSVGKKFDELKQSGAAGWVGVEESPYMQEPLNIQYPSVSADTLIENAKKAFHQWRKTDVQDRAGILVESLERVKARFFEVAYATMHTTGQGYMMAFQASGPHAADRALEAIAAGYEELSRFPQGVIWDKPMGKYNIKLDKEWRAVPKGIGLVIGCSTFPTWNSVPGIYASLITGNPVIVKPHPGAVLPIAIFIAEIQNVLSDNGLDPNICQLAVDTYDKMISKELAEHPDVKIIDFTGNSEFGSYLERLEGKAVFTEKTGVNSVILDAVDDVDKVAANLAFSVTLYSGQMCTAPQNFYIPENGINTPNGRVSFDEFAQKLVDNINGLVDNPKAGPFVLGTIQNKNTCSRVDKAKEIGGKVWLESRSIENPMFKNARISTPVIIEVDATDKEKFSKELFGPIALLIKTKDTNASIALAKEMALKYGAISCGAYTTDPGVKEKIADEMALAATPVSFNLVGGIYMNQNAGFSDFHVTGGNPAGNASFTNPEYVIKRFTWVGHREPAKV
ncbi:Phenylacetic acid degradation protein PaaN2, ring-opening aldehyde dehydrogenase [Fulvivirga imtechensis AK7]|uniref:Phenylacetic acid degradation protein PaaN2, ring-opening aldehyde dehydrogenase n=1 Tax=Fulvivirga imtechensis AK7 TaxID=1237149 RepID=L8JWU5_9BACT|nr:phenylacetic acid degradation protein PaaN [Fulvivirga imtechensis]ELR73541.1 Phenylacetic acid degradation protein PaaN2, ring-opening aldehyde dehydrogenase [Fulvivirga imtechensis AK7]